MTTPAEIIDRAILAIWNDPQVKSSMVDTRQAFLQAISEAGHIIVPEEPTEAMIRSGTKQFTFPSPHMMRGTVADIYRAMIAAHKDTGA